MKEIAMLKYFALAAVTLLAAWGLLDCDAHAQSTPTPFSLGFAQK